MKPDEPDEPRPSGEIEAIVRALAAEDPPEIHPAAAALSALDEDPESLAPRTRAWLEAHLAECGACARALRAVPRLELRRRPLLLRPWPLAAAAGWLLASLLALRGLAPRVAPAEPFPAVHSLVLSSERGGGAVEIPASARLLRLELVLGEDVPLGAELDVRLEDRAGRVALQRRLAVVERNERDWPVLTLDREALPRGPARLVVRTPSGAESVFELGL